MTSIQNKSATPTNGVFRASLLAGAILTISMTSSAQEPAVTSDLPDAINAPAEQIEVASSGTQIQSGVISTNPVEVLQAREAEPEQEVKATVGPDAMKALLNGPEKVGTPQSLESVPWALSVETRPWPLRQGVELTFPGLILSLPPTKDLRMMLPGVMDDRISHLNLMITKYQTDVTSMVAQAHGRAEQEFLMWSKAVQERSKKLDKHEPWQNYQFALELRAITGPYKAEYLQLSESIRPRLQAQFSNAVEQITGVMNESEGHAQKMGWYNLLVQLKDGFTVLQQNILETNEAYIEKINDIEKQFPLLPMPEGPKPLTEDQRLAKVKADMQIASSAQTTVAAPAERKPAPELPNQSESSFGGLIAVFVGLLTVVGGFFMVRKRKTPKASKV